jgi:hypothetical protein
MKKEHVPQDDNPTYRGYGRKVIYAQDYAGGYTTVKSSGWEAEEVVLQDVVDDFQHKAEKAKARVIHGEASPIEYFMHLKMMDLVGLASGVGIMQWRVKRHLTSRTFKKLKPAMIKRYADFFGIEPARLTRFEEYI